MLKNAILMADDIISQQLQRELWNIQQQITDLMERAAAIEARIADKLDHGARYQAGKYRREPRRFTRRILAYKPIVQSLKGDAWIEKQREAAPRHEYTVWHWAKIVNPNEKIKK
jgi:hypothetical protein